MSYTVEWYLAGRIDYVTYSGVLTDDDIITSSSVMLPFLEASPHPIHALINVTGLTELAVNFAKSINNEVIAQASSHRKLGWVLYFDKANPVYMFMASVKAQTHNERVRFFDSEEEALLFLESVDQLKAGERATARQWIAGSPENPS